jgi:hypothetical protein
MKTIACVAALTMAFAALPLQNSHGDISGKITRSGSTEAIPNVLISLLGPLENPQSRKSVTTTTDAYGNFLLPDVVPGQYRLQAQRDGFFTSSTSNTSTLTRTVSIHEGEHLRGTNLSLVPGGTISGQITDSNGAPMLKVPLTVLEMTYGPDGQRLLRPAVAQTTNAASQGLEAALTSVGRGSLAGAFVTDAAGNFRIFWLHAGQYYLRADSAQSLFSGPNHQNDPAEYATTFYPGATAVSAAGEVTVNAGVETSGIVLHLQKPGKLTVTGRLLGIPNSDPRSSYAIYLLPQGENAISDSSPVARATVRPSEPFKIQNVTPGSYELVARSIAGTAAFGEVPVEVGKSNTAEVGIPMHPDIDIKGTVVQTGSAATVALGSLKIGLRGGLLGNETRSATVGSDGTFVLRGARFGENVISVSGLSAKSYVQDILQGAASVMESGRINVKDEDTNPIKIVVNSSGGGTIEGSIRSATSKDAGDIIVLVPQSQFEKNPTLYRRTVADAMGHFIIGAIKPGAYRLIAFTYIADNAYLNVEFMRQHGATGIVVNVRAGNPLAVEIPSPVDN